MLTQIDSISKKYAIAYLNLYFNQMTDDAISNLIKLKKFLYKNKKFHAYLGIPKLSVETKINFIDRLCKAFNLSENEINFIHVLIKQKRIELINPIFKKIIELYYIQKNIFLVNVCTSCTINDKQKSIIINFVHNLIKKEDIKINFCVDKNLISGIKIKSNTLLWEHSVRKHLKILKNNLLQQAIL